MAFAYQLPQPQAALTLSPDPLFILPRPLAASRRLLAAGALWELLVVCATAAAPRVPAGPMGLVALVCPGLLLAFQGWRGLDGRCVFDSVAISLAPSPACLGSNLEVQLVCHPATRVVLSRLAVYLRCHERAVLREGPRELPFEKKVFEKSALLGERLDASPGHPLSYRAQLRVPTDKSCSYQSAHASISWSVAFEVEAGGWPATTRSWPLVVMPVLAS